MQLENRIQPSTDALLHQGIELANSSAGEMESALVTVMRMTREYHPAAASDAWSITAGICWSKQQ